MNRVVLAVLVAGAFAVGGCGAGKGPEQVAEDLPKPTSSSVTPTNDPAAEAAASALGPLLETGFPQTYAGLRLVGDRVVVYRLPDQALDDAARAAAHGARLELSDAKFPLSRLKEVAERIDADAEYWKGRNVRISTWGPAVDGSAVDVTTVDGSDADRAALAERYGADVIRLSKGDFPTTAPAPATT
ncbi:hypothetical protein ABZ816_16820 [Actinosynnema sp. NPDC047251]|uniref:Putative secreted protein n=1 Tax=Saccharothrix espanaensis (strain ATCC 51144 / DSM 44229 / JCM 9112 / NBRC 15066 / NRRL 15764) TaxID=1179773 RepID=K0JRZ1_SACES|nr:hypothetical protein [Saccharothrix espanaensis]CCH30440.1 putative secreted protein [Saccharothrix espanaensis DSM 44229]